MVVRSKQLEKKVQQIKDKEKEIYNDRKLNAAIFESRLMDDEASKIYDDYAKID